MIDSVRVAAIQMVSTPDIDSNLNSARSLILNAAEQGAQLAVLPEYFPVMSNDENDKLQCQEPFGSGRIQDFLAENARQSDMWLMGGSIPLESTKANLVSNSCLLFNPQGICVARYDKIHLFDVNLGGKDNEAYCESNTIEPGIDVVSAMTPFANIGMSICYDLRFPELYRRLASRDAAILTVPAAFTETTGRQHWELLLRARAVENQCFVIAANQGGQHTAKRLTWGHSMIISPSGDILDSIEKGAGVICADLDLNYQRELRASFPVLKHTQFID